LKKVEMKPDQDFIAATTAFYSTIFSIVWVTRMHRCL